MECKHIKPLVSLGCLVLTLFLCSVYVDELYAQDRLAYGDRGNRFEGHRRTEVSAPALEVLSFTRGKPLTAQRAPGTLNAHFYLPQAQIISIKARELVAVNFYEMVVKQTDWPSGTNTFGPWKTSDVIDRLGVSLANVGGLAMVGSIRAGSGGEIAALSFSKADMHSTVYQLVFRVKYDVKKTSFRVERISTGAQVVSGVKKQIMGGAPVSLQFDLANTPEGQYRIVLDCLYKGRRGGPVRTFSFYHKP